MFWMIAFTLITGYLLLLGLITVLAGLVAKHNGLLVVRSRCISFVATVGITASIFSWHWFINPLPSDEYMIEHLEQNRDEYDELIAGYIEAKQRGNDAMKSWLTSPRKVALQHKVQARDERVNPEESQWHGGIEVNSGLGDRKKIVYSMEFHLAGATTRSIREGSTIWKSYWYFPEAQPLTSGKSLCTSGSGKQCLGKMNIEVLPSLNNYPLFSGVSGDRERWCGSYMRQMDEHWFLAFSKACL